MFSDELKIKYIGGPTALLEIDTTRFLTDPTFDDAGTKYDAGLYVLHKLYQPKISLNDIGYIDYVLLSHDHHFDNLDNAGRQLLAKAGTVYTTVEGAQRLNNNAVGIKNWETKEVPLKDGKVISITGTPCRHGPSGGDRGPVTGFVLNYKGNLDGAVYVTGDTVYYRGVEEVAERYRIRLILLFVGAAVVKNVGTQHLTMTAAEALQVARLFPDAMIVPLHFEGWEHFTEGRKEIEEVFAGAGLGNKLQWAE